MNASAFFLLANADPISGGAGWVGAGLLGAVLAWLLLVHLPGKDKQMREFYTAKEASDREQMKAFRESLDIVVKHCEEENEKMAAVFRELLKR